MKQNRPVILNYHMGNITSLQNSLDYLSVNHKLAEVPNELEKATHIILPGVGAFNKAMKNLHEMNIIEKLKILVLEKKIKILGICLGMQLLGLSSTENGFTKGLGFIENTVERFTNDEVKNNKIPHVGFNSINIKNDNKFFDGIKNNSDFYFVHSYRMIKENFMKDYAICNYGSDFLAAFNINNIYGTQFHPEKSQSNGLRLLFNFLKS